MQVNSIGSNNQNFGMRLRASQEFWDAIKTATPREMKESVTALKNINSRTSIKDVYDIMPIEETFQKRTGLFGKVETYVKKGFELVDNTKKQVLYNYNETLASDGAEEVTASEFLKFISKCLSSVEAFERKSDKQKAALRALQAKVSSCIDSVKID